MKRCVFAALMLAAVISFCSCGKARPQAPVPTVSGEFSVEGNVISARFFNRKTADVYGSVKFPGGSVTLYYNDECTEYLHVGEELPLTEGIAEYKLRVSNGEEYRDYTLQTESHTVTALRVETKYEKTYRIGESFDRGSVTVVAVCVYGDETEINDYVAEAYFEAEGEGVAVLSLEGVTCEVRAEVKGERYVPTLDGRMSDGTLGFSFSDDGVILSSAKGAAGYAAIPEKVVCDGKEYAVKGISPYCFEGAERLVKLDLPSGITVGEGAFAGCASLCEVTLGSGCETEGYAFSDCTSLEKVKLPDDLRFVPDGMFAGCSSLEEIILPPTVEYVGIRAFADCVRLRTVDFPESNRRIGARAFKGCASLKEVVCNRGTTAIGDGAFSYCPSLKLLVLPEKATVGDGILYGSDNVTLCTGKTSEALRNAKLEGTKSVVLKENGLTVIDHPEKYALGDEIIARDFSAVLYTEDCLGAARNIGFIYDFSVPGTRAVTVTCGEYSRTVDVFVSYPDEIFGDTDRYGARYTLDRETHSATLVSVPEDYPLDTFIVPTEILSGGELYYVTGIGAGAIRCGGLEKLIISSEISYIGDGAVADCPRLSVVVCGVRAGKSLKIGDGNFTGLMPELVILCEMKNSVMHNFVRKNSITYAGTVGNSLYITAGTGARSSYSVGESFDPTGFSVLFVGEDLSVTRIPSDEVTYEYDFAESNVVKCVWNGYSSDYAVSLK